jgi:hypothetical protein
MWLSDTAARQFLTDLADRIATKARKYAKTQRIAGAISVDPVATTTEGLYSIDIVVDINPESDKGAPEFPAYEWGSGLFGPKGEKYAIVPTNEGGLLVFPEERWPKFVLGLTPVAPYKGKFYLRRVMHPGVKAEPCMKPAIDKERDKLSIEALDSIVVNIIGAEITQI